MALLADYAITPDVFHVTSYPTEGECAARLETIRERGDRDAIQREFDPVVRPDKLVERFGIGT